MPAVTESIALGMAGLSVPSGAHICGFFRGGAERDAIVGSFIQEGLRSSDKCLCVLDVTDGDSIPGRVSGDLEPAPGQLVYYTSNEAYLGDDDFTMARMLRFWEESVVDALGPQGYARVRATGEMSLVVSRIIGDELLIYEAELNRFVSRYPQVFLCLYDLDQVSGDLLVDLMSTHPKVLMGSTVLDNLYYIEPDEFLAGRA